MVEIKSISPMAWLNNPLERIARSFVPEGVQQEQLLPLIESSPVFLLGNILALVLVLVLGWVLMPYNLLIMSAWAGLILLLCFTYWFKALHFKSGKRYLPNKLYSIVLQQFVIITATTFLWGSLSSLIIDTPTLYAPYLIILSGLAIIDLPLLFISYNAYLLQLAFILITSLASTAINFEQINSESLHYFLPLCTILLVVMLLTASMVIEHYFRQIHAERSHLLEARVSTDDLTGLSNLVYFDRSLKKEWRTTQRYHQELSLMIIHIDQFHNHAFSEEGYYTNEAWEKVIAECIRNIFKRATDLPARCDYGLFGVILPDTSLTNACIIAERLRAQVEDRHMRYLNDKQAITVSIAVGSFQSADPVSILSPNILVDKLHHLLDQHSRENNQVYRL